MTKPVIDQKASLTFSDYYSLRVTAAEIAEHFGYTLHRKRLTLPYSDDNGIEVIAAEIEQQINNILPYVNLDSETARREVLISPLMFRLVELVKPQINIEYWLSVSDQLKGTVDYYISSQSSQILIVEAKLADTEKGFKQLIAEMVAFQQREELEISIYGAVTTGETWHFGRLNPKSKILERDINFYTEPQGIKELLSVLVGILTEPPLIVEGSTPDG
ncbi:MAG: hypothetical protein ACFB4I_23310 [Cyanophyceae cyanobacterium]